VVPVDSCRALVISAGWCWAVAIPSTSLLFFLWVRAVFEKQGFVVTFFGGLRLATLGGCVTAPFALNGTHIGDTDRCIRTSVKPIIAAGLVTSTCNDTLVLIAISWHVVMRNTVEGRVKSLFGGRELPYISRQLVQGGQQYYLSVAIVYVRGLPLIALIASSSQGTS
jgi:hypothetical protein